MVGVESEEGGGEVPRSRVGKAEARLAGAVAGARTLRNYRGGGSWTRGETSRRWAEWHLGPGFTETANPLVSMEPGQQVVGGLS